MNRWKQVSGYGDRIIVDSDSNPICRMGDSSNRKDALLIAAAPLMLETLKDIESYCETHGGLDELLKVTGLKKLIKIVEC